MLAKTAGPANPDRLINLSLQSPHMFLFENIASRAASWMHVATNSPNIQTADAYVSAVPCTPLFVGGTILDMSYAAQMLCLSLVNHVFVFFVHHMSPSTGDVLVCLIQCFVDHVYPYHPVFVLHLGDTVEKALGDTFC